MKRKLVVAVLSLAFAAGLIACEKKGPAEKAGEQMDEAMEEAGKKLEEAGDAVEEALSD